VTDELGQALADHLHDRLAKAQGCKGGDLLAASLNAEVLRLPVGQEWDPHGHRPSEGQPLAWPMAAAHPAHTEGGLVLQCDLSG